MPNVWERVRNIWRDDLKRTEEISKAVRKAKLDVARDVEEVLLGQALQIKRESVQNYRRLNGGVDWDDILNVQDVKLRVVERTLDELREIEPSIEARINLDEFAQVATQEISEMRSRGIAAENLGERHFRRSLLVAKAEIERNEVMEEIHRRVAREQHGPEFGLEY